MMFGLPMTGNHLATWAKYLATVELPVMQEGFTKMVEKETLDELKKLLNFSVKYADRKLYDKAI